MDASTSTLVGAEQRWAPVTWVAFVICALVGTTLLIAFWNAYALAFAIPWLMLTASNAIYVARHERPSVGMIPISVASLAPVATHCLLTGRLEGVPRGAMAALLLLSLFTVVLFAFWFARLHRTFAHASAVTDDAIIVVLGGAIRHGRPRRTLATRLDIATTLAKGHPQRTFVLSGGPVPKEGMCEADAMAAYLMERGISANQLLLERQAKNTRENMVFSLKLVKPLLGTRQTCVLTSDYHLYRAVHEGRRAGAEFVPLAAPTPLSGRLQQWCREVLTILSKG